jgi:hypothetical protein
MDFSFGVIRSELASEKFRLLYLQMQSANPNVLTFPSFPDIIYFFQKQTGDYEKQDTIMRCLVMNYQQGGPYNILSSVFLVLFEPVILKLFGLGRRACWSVPDEDIAQEINILLLQSIRETDPDLPQVSNRFTGALKNKFQKFIKEKIKEAKGETAYDDTLAVFAPDEESEGEGDDQTTKQVEEYDLAKFRLHLDELIRKRKITKKDKRLLIATMIEGKVLKKIVPKNEYEKYKARLRRFKKANKKMFAKLMI